MVRTFLLALALGLLGGAPYLGVWEAAGSMADPDGVRTNAGGMWDPNGSSAEGDAGGMSDPNGSNAEGDAGGHFDPDG